MDNDKEYILKFAHENKIKFIRLWFTDILGFLKSFAITIDELDDAINAISGPKITHACAFQTRT